MQKIIVVNVFAVLNEYFEERFDLPVFPGSTCSSVLEDLAALRPSAAGLLSKCRVAGPEEILDNEAVIDGIPEIYLIPPSSGG